MLVTSSTCIIALFKCNVNDYNKIFLFFCKKKRLLVLLQPKAFFLFLRNPVFCIPFHIRKRNCRQFPFHCRLHPFQLIIQHMMDISPYRTKRIRVFVKMEQRLLRHRFHRLINIQKRNLLQWSCYFHTTRATRNRNQPCRL